MVQLTPGNVRAVRIEEEMRSAYLDYAMSVIVARALPDVRDGLKPVHRRILYAMHEMGLRPSASYKKSAGVVGEVMGKYHPHGDAPVYDSLVRMAQTFSMRYPLIQGQGNFGSVDDDPPAAMRYTEARLSSIAEEILVDIDRDTVDFADNYDGSHQEPRVFPARLPNLLVNGSSGIAVGMATSIPPHNLREVCDAIIHLLDHPEATIDDLLSHLHGPDFPTAGIIMGRAGLRNAYHTGRGRVIVRARATIEEMERRDRQQIVVTELPFQVNKATLVEKIALLSRERRVEGISEVRDESDREGLRVVVELQRGAAAEQVLNNLYKNTALQTAFHYNMLALVEGQPRLLNLRQSLVHYVDFRRSVVRRRAEHELRRSRDRAHVLEGMRKALEYLDEVIALIRDAADAETARVALTVRFALTETQAQAILDMQLRRMAALERRRIEDEYQSLMARIAELEDLLGSPSQITAVVRDETVAHRTAYGDGRRTEIWDDEALDFTKEELTPHTDVVVTLSHRGYVKRLPIEAYRLQRRGGKGVRGQETREGDAIRQLIVADSHDWLLFFTDRGRVYRERVFNIRPDNSRATRGIPVQNIIGIGSSERVTALVAVAVTDLNVSKFIVMATRRGEIKQMLLSQFANIRANGLAALDLDEGDSMVSARLAEPDMSVIVVTRNGKGVQFALEEIPLRQTRGAGGVRAIRLSPDDQVIAMDVARPGHMLLVLTERGYGKRTAVRQFRTTGRNVVGVIALKVSERTGSLAAAAVTGPDVEEVMVGSAKAMVYRTRIQEIRMLGRATQGVKVMDKLDPSDRVISISAFKERPHLEEASLPRLASPTSQTNGKRPPRQLSLESEVADTAYEIGPQDSHQDGEEEQEP